jgi:HEAT repeat protein
VAQWEGPLFNRELPAEIRVWVVTQLALEPVPEATAVLVRALAEPEVRVVRAVVAALDQRGDSAARPALERLRAHPDPQISRQVGKVLEKL